MMARTYVGGPLSHSVSYFQQHELGASNNEATTINGHNNNNNNKGHFPKRKPGPPKNIVQRLIHREIHFVNSNVSPFIANHKLHQNLLPNFSVENIEKPNCFLRKFTYDGRYMLAFSSDQTCVELYEYQGPAAAAHLLQGISSIHHDTLEAADPIPNNPEAESIKKNIFSMFFRLKHTVPVTSNGEQLNRECSLFTENHRYAIVVSVTFANDETAVFYDLYQNNESLPIGGRSLLEDYTLHVIDMERGLVVDRRSYKTDKIYLSYNHGIYLYKNTLAVLSMQHQTIHIYHIHPDGSLIDVRKIGRFCFEDDAALINYRPSFLGAARPANRNNTVHPFREVPFNTLKHRLLVFLFKYSQVQSSIKGNNLPTKQFFNDFNIFTNLRIWKMQLLDEEHILLKYEQEESLMNRENLFRNWNLFVVYNLRTSEIVNVYPQSSEEFLYIYENFVDYFRHPPYYICSLSNNVFAKKNHDKLMKTCADAKGGSYKDAIKMILAFLPLNAQSYSPSPYLDLSLFSYDDKCICVFEKPRPCNDSPIRFYDRESGRLLYKLAINPDPRPPAAGTPAPLPASTRRLVAFILHPTDPFIITVMRVNAQYSVNLHFRHNNPLSEEEEEEIRQLERHRMNNNENGYFWPQNDYFQQRSLS